MRGTLKEIEVERWGSEQARRYQAGSLTLSKTSISPNELSGPASAPVFFFLPIVFPQHMQTATLGISSFSDLFVEVVGGGLKEHIKKRPALA